MKRAAGRICCKPEGRDGCFDGISPEQLSEEELASVIQEAITQTGASSIKDMGKVMGIVTAKTKGRADAKLIGALAKKMLS